MSFCGRLRLSFFLEDLLPFLLILDFLGLSWGLSSLSLRWEHSRSISSRASGLMALSSSLNLVSLACNSCFYVMAGVLGEGPGCTYYTSWSTLREARGHLSIGRQCLKGVMNHPDRRVYLGPVWGSCIIFEWASWWKTTCCSSQSVKACTVKSSVLCTRSQS